MKLLVWLPVRYAHGATSEDLGPHITLVYSDRATGDVDAILDAVEAIVDDVPDRVPLTGAVEMFGDDADVPVALCEASTLVGLRDRVLVALAEAGCSAPATWPEFRPHITLADRLDAVDSGAVLVGAPVVRLTDGEDCFEFDFDVQALAQLTDEQRTPTKAMQEEAQRALDRRAELPPSKRGGTPVGVARGRDIANGVPLSLRTIKRSANFCSRSGKWSSDAGEVARGLWACDTGADWFDSRIRIAEGPQTTAERAGGLMTLASLQEPYTLSESQAPAMLAEDGTGKPMIVLGVGPNTAVLGGKPVAVTVTRAHLEEIVRVLDLQRAEGHYEPRIDWRHGTSPYLRKPDGTEPDAPKKPSTGLALGRVKGWRIVERPGVGAGLEITPRYNNAGVDIVRQHMTPDGLDSDLFPSAEFVVDGEIHRRDGGGQIGTAALFAVGLQPRQQQDDARVTPAMLAENGPPPGGAMEENRMDLIRSLMAAFPEADRQMVEDAYTATEGDDAAKLAAATAAFKECQARLMAPPAEPEVLGDKPEAMANDAGADFEKQVEAMAERLQQLERTEQQRAAVMATQAEEAAFKASGLAPADRPAFAALHRQGSVQALAEFVERHKVPAQPERQVVPTGGVQALAEGGDVIFGGVNWSKAIETQGKRGGSLAACARNTMEANR